MTIFHNLSGRFCNWEVVTLVIVSEVATDKRFPFFRSEIMKYGTLENARKLLMFMGHKKDPGSLENTLQSNIQKLRDKGYIDFLNRGEYSLTAKGLEAIQMLDPNIFRIWRELKEIAIPKVQKLIELYTSGII